MRVKDQLDLGVKVMASFSLLFAFLVFKSHLELNRESQLPTFKQMSSNQIDQLYQRFEASSKEFASVISQKQEVFRLLEKSVVSDPSEIGLEPNSNATEAPVPPEERASYEAYRIQSDMKRWKFRYVLSPYDTICSKRPDLFGIIIVHTAPRNYKKRMFIRETYGSKFASVHTKFSTVFALGSTKDQLLMTQLAAENAQFGDIMQGDFIDDYRNLTYKSIMWLKWSTDHCPNVLYTLKVDDDIFVNAFRLAAHLSRLYKQGIGRSMTFLCAVHNGMTVIRQSNDKWYVPHWMFKNSSYPIYCSGSAYVITQDLVKQLYQRYRKIKYFWVDDAYVTGLLPMGLNVTHYDMGSLYILQFDPPENANVAPAFLNGYILFGHTGIPLSKRYKIWKQLVEQKGLKLN